MCIHRPQRSIEQDGRILRIISRFIAQRHVEIIQISRHQQQGAIHRISGHACFQTLLFHPIQYRLVNLDQAEVFDRFQIQGHVTFPPFPGLGQDADVGTDGVVVQVSLTLIERVDPIEDPLDPALDEHRLHPLGIFGSGDHGIRVRGLIAHGKITIREDDERIAQG